MKKKTIQALKKFEKMSPANKLLAVGAAATIFPVAVIIELTKKPRYQLKPQKRRRR